MNIFDITEAYSSIMQEDKQQSLGVACEMKESLAMAFERKN